MWDGALKASAAIFRDLAERGIELSMLNLGGGFPTRYLKDVPPVKVYGRTIFRALRRHFGNRIPETIIEPGRGMVGNAGIIEAEVVLISKKSETDSQRWVYLDIGKFNGLAETMDEMIRYPIRTPCDARRARPLRAGGAELRLGRRALREGAVLAAGFAGDRRQGADRRNRRLHVDLRVGRLQRLPAAESLRDLRGGDVTSAYRSRGASVRRARTPKRPAKAASTKPRMGALAEIAARAVSGSRHPALGRRTTAQLVADGQAVRCWRSSTTSPSAACLRFVGVAYRAHPDFVAI